MRKKQKNVCRVLNYIEHLCIKVSKITGCVSISAFPSLVSIPTGIMSSVIGLKICVITTGSKKYKSMIKKNKKKHGKIVLPSKSPLNIIEVSTSNSLSDSNISHDEFVLINNVGKEFYDMKEKIKNSNNK